MRNKKKCIICGKEFGCPPSATKYTCSRECSKVYMSQKSVSDVTKKKMSEAHKGKKTSEETKKKLSEIHKGRDLSQIQPLAVEAAKVNPKTGKFETNVSAKNWHLISPEGKEYKFRSLSFWLRENCKELFGCEPDSREFKNVRAGLTSAKSASLGKGKYQCCTYKGWKVIPTKDDETED